jgi:2-oxoisovalerate dehydrogenase E1 component alpha subunit
MAHVIEHAAAQGDERPTGATTDRIRDLMAGRSSPPTVGARRPGAVDETVPDRHGPLGLSDADAVRLYRLMLLARRVSERTLALAFQNRIALAAPSDGHEAAQVGAVCALEPGDPIYAYYRGLGSALARGYSVEAVMLDHFGRASAPSGGGRVMPCHWSDPRLRLMTNSSSVGTHIPHAAGTALGSKLRGEPAVTYASFGDGAVSKGDFHEGVSFAAIHKLPVVFVCENNGYAISVPSGLQSPVESIARRADGAASAIRFWNASASVRSLTRRASSMRR